MNPESKQAVRRKILVVDDEESILHFLKTALEKRGFDVSTAADGKEGVSFYLKQRPDLVLLDIRLPKINGVDVLRKIKKKDPKALVMMITAFGAKRTIAQAMKLGAQDYINKPFDLKDMLKAIDENLSLRAMGQDVEEFKAKLGG